MTRTDLVRLLDAADTALADQLRRHRTAQRGPQPTVRLCWCWHDGRAWRTGRGAEAVPIGVGREVQRRLAEAANCDVWLETVGRVG